MKTFEEFWPHYMKNHSHPINRKLHMLGTVSAFGMTISALLLQNYLMFVCAPLLAFSLAWLGHFAVERNTPAFLGHPVWSVRGELRMVRAEIRRLLLRN